MSDVVEYKILMRQDISKFERGLTLLDEAVGEFMADNTNPYSTFLEIIIRNIVLYFDNQEEK